MPFQKGRRLLRVSMLARALVAQGHTVTWITSTFVHLDKEELFPADHIVQQGERYQIHLLSAGGYRKNISLRRYLFYRRYAARLRAYLRQLPVPDIIVCGFPQIDAAAVGVDYARSQRIPIIIDVRDFWPDGVINFFPAIARPLVQATLLRQFQHTRHVFRSATALCAMSHGVLHWALARASRRKGDNDQVFPLGYPHPHLVPDAPSNAIRSIAQQVSGRVGLAYVGTFGHTYDLSTVVKAAEQLAARHDQRYHFLLIGRGPTYPAIVAQTRNLPNITCTDWQSPDAVQFLLGHCQAGILPWKGPAGAMPNKFFDYLASSLPVISSAQGELNDLILGERIGSCYRSEDVRGLLKAIEALCGLPTVTAQHRVNARRIFMERFGEKSVYARFSDHIEKVANEAAHFG